MLTLVELLKSWIWGLLLHPTFLSMILLRAQWIRH